MPLVKSHVRTTIFTGLFILIPLLITYIVLRWLFYTIDGVLGPLVDGLLGFHVPGMGILGMVLVIYAAGLLASNVAGRRVFGFWERQAARIPVVRNVYVGTKQLIQVVSDKNSRSFKKVVLVEYPRRGIYTIGFLAGRCQGELAQHAGPGVSAVFIPTAPNPTSGYLLVVPRDEMKELDMSVEDAFKLIISGGMLAGAGPGGGGGEKKGPALYQSSSKV